MLVDVKPSRADETKGLWLGLIGVASRRWITKQPGVRGGGKGKAPVVAATVPSAADDDYRRTSRLLDFDTKVDEAFITGARVVDSQGRAASGAAEVTGKVVIKTRSLLSGREFPGTWTLVGDGALGSSRYQRIARVADTSEKVLYALVTGAVADRLIAPTLESRAGAHSH